MKAIQKMLTGLAFCASAMLAGSVAEAAFAPTDLTGLSAWLRSDVGVVTIGANVTQWQDFSGNNNHANAGVSPIVVANGLAGRQSINFGNSATAHLNLPTSSTLGIQNSDYEIFIVAKTTSSDIQFLTAGAIEQYEMHLNGVSGLRGIPTTLNRRDVGANGQFVSAPTDERPHVFSLRVNANVGFARADGSDSAGLSPAQSASDTAIRLGLRSNNTLGFAGDMGEVIIFDRALTGTERVAVETYLRQEWLPLKLVEVGPVGNPAPVGNNIAHVANGGIAFAKDAAFGPTHSIVKANDGIYGNSNSWIGATTNSFVGVAFDDLYLIDQVAWGRDNDGAEPFFIDRTSGIYTVQYTQAANPNAATLDSDWITIDSIVYTPEMGSDRALRHLYSFDPVLATGLRIRTTSTALTENGLIAIDELEVFAIIVPEPATMSLLALGALAMGRRRRRNELCQN